MDKNMCNKGCKSSNYVDLFDFLNHMLEPQILQVELIQNKDMNQVKNKTCRKHAIPSVTLNDINVTIKDYEIIVPEKVIRVEFIDGTKEKVVCDEKDKFDLDHGLRICVAKKAFRKDLTGEGIEYVASRLKYFKCIEKMIHKVHVYHNQKIREAEKKKKQCDNSCKKCFKDREVNEKSVKSSRLNIKKTKHKDVNESNE